MLPILILICSPPMSESPGLQAFCPRPNRWFTCKKFPPKKPPTATYKFRNRPPKGGGFSRCISKLQLQEKLWFLRNECVKSFSNFWKRAEFWYILMLVANDVLFPLPTQPPTPRCPEMMKGSTGSFSHLPGANWNRDVATFLEVPVLPMTFHWKAQTLDLESKLPRNCPTYQAQFSTNLPFNELSDSILSF